jgi:hypothetical protein
MAGQLLFTGVVWGSILSVIGAFAYLAWMVIET